jgi:hypothetical membrane protein
VLGRDALGHWTVSRPALPPDPALPEDVERAHRGSGPMKEIVMTTQAHLAPLGVQSEARATHRWLDDVRIPGVLLFVLAAQFMTVIMLGTSMAPDYDVRGGAISDLGVIDETAMLFNGSLLVTGILNLVAGYLLFRSHGRAWLLAIFAVAGIGAIGAGLVPLDAGGLHGLFALTAFLFFNLQALAATAIVHGPMRVVSALAGLVGLGFVVLMVIGDAGNPAVFGPIGHGGAERLIVYPVMLWMLAFGGYLMSGSADYSDAPPRGSLPLGQ